MIKHCIFSKPVISYYYDGTEESAKFVEENFSNFEYCMWKEEFWENERMMLIYHGDDSRQGDYYNIVPPDVFIVEFKMRTIVTDWFDTKEFEDNFIVL